MQEYVEVMFGRAVGGGSCLCCKSWGKAAGRGMRIPISMNTCK